MSGTYSGPERRLRRRNQTVEEIMDTAVAVMTEEGVAALNLTEVARRMGLQAPSLYKYFPSKLAVYDALFIRGMSRIAAVFQSAEQHADPLEALGHAQQAMIDWCVANPVLTELTLWRPVPGFTPSPEASQAAHHATDRLRRLLTRAVEAGRLVPAAAADEGLRIFSALYAGLVTLQLAKEPGVRAPEGHFTRLGPTALDLFVRHYSRHSDTGSQ